jgi:hypothetical protein
VAAERAVILGDWLHAHNNALGPDGRVLVAKLDGRIVDVPATYLDAVRAVGEMVTSSKPVAMRRCRRWTVVMQWSRPVGIVWLENDLLDRGPLGDHLGALLDGRSSSAVSSGNMGLSYR